ncbi:MAG: acyl carrier protein [Clostridia bacterium]|nr:acyl carrier protein [Clostridia bacterium]MBQ3927027.1 acyl carrier protein [Clostridia bacterium]MBQ7728548.1 acyl carrier protein [Clostridia bacterium]
MFEKLRDLLVSKFDFKEDQITEETKLSTDLGLNSIELAELIMACEDEFGITIEDEDIHDFETVKDVADYLEKLVNNK